MESLAEESAVVAAMVAERSIERAKEHFQSRHKDNDFPGFGEKLFHGPEGRNIVVDVFEDIKTDDGVKVIGAEVLQVKVFQGQWYNVDIAVVAESFGGSSGAGGIWLQGGDLGIVEEELGDVANAGADFENTVAEKMANFGEYPMVVEVETLEDVERLGEGVELGSGVALRARQCDTGKR